MAYAPQMLRVNLSNGEIKKETIDPTLSLKFIGGRGLGSKILYDELDPEVEPLSPENKLILAPGPLTGTGAPAGSRYMVITKSPLSGTIACSNAGGNFPAELKSTGYDLLIVEGRASQPVYIWIENEKVEIRSAAEAWGKTTHETEDIIKAQTDKSACIAGIGPSGEKLTRISSVINDKHRSAGRSGVGAVMGSKNLKAIAVRGTKGMELADRTAFKELSLRLMKELPQNPVIAGYTAQGTTGGVKISSRFGVFPTRNYRQDLFEGADNIAHKRFHETIFVKNKACYHCPVGCKRITKVDNPPFQGAGEGPEYETIYAFGAMTAVDNLEAIAKAGYICNEYGMDTISAGVTVACLMELFEKGFVTEDQIGRPLPFGDAYGMVAIVEKMAKREGIGDIMAEGSLRMAGEFGHPELSMSVKGLEFPGWGTRACQGMGVQYATGNRGACHVRGNTMGVELLSGKVNPLITEGKAQLAMSMQDNVAAHDSTGLCLFVAGVIPVPDVIALLQAATGNTYTKETFKEAGARIWNLERLFNLKAGFTYKDDTLPERLLKEASPGGPGQGLVVKLDEMLPEYYKLRGWDEKGVPTAAKLAQLGL